MAEIKVTHEEENKFDLNNLETEKCKACILKWLLKISILEF